tara:strand:+ start:695 stop:940 length:246 start_codon:yes stop_codon:yes gene_type:complete
MACQIRCAGLGEIGMDVAVLVTFPTCKPISGAFWFTRLSGKHMLIKWLISKAQANRPTDRLTTKSRWCLIFVRLVQPAART